MTKINDNLEHELKKLYVQVPSPPGGLVAGRERMMAEAARLQATARSRSISHPTETEKTQRRRNMKLLLAYKIIAAVMAVVVGTTSVGGGVAFASADSLPGNALYPVKLAVEDARLALTGDPASRAELTLAFAAERTEEMQQLMAQGKSVPEDVIVRLARHTEQAMAQIAQARPEEVPGLLEQVMERTRTQQQVLEQACAAAPEQSQATLRHALEVTNRAYETASAAQGDPERFQHEYQHRYQSTPGPHGEESPTPVPPCETCTPAQDQDQNRDRERNRDQIGTPVSTAEPEQDRDQDRNRDQDQNQDQDRDRDQSQDQDQQQDQDQDGDQDQNQDQDQQQDQNQQQDQDQDQSHTPEHTPEPAKTPGPSPTHTPEHGKGSGGCH